MSTEDDELLGRVPRSLRAANGIPDPEQAAARERAAALASEALADLLLPDGVRTSPLGPGWSRDIDLHLQDWPKPARLEALGWVPLDPLLHYLGTLSRGEWAVTEDGTVLASVDLHLGSPPDPVTTLLNRCRRRGEVRVREVLEARALLRSGYTLPVDDPVIHVAARIEAGLGGQALAPWRDGPDIGEAPGSLSSPVRRRFREGLAILRSALRPRLVVAVSGVDGSGKSTLSRLVTRNLDRAGVPVGYVWARPGMRLGWVNGLAQAAKRLVGQDPSPGFELVAKGTPAGGLASRRGILGWIWAMLVTLSFLVDVHRQHLMSRGIVLYDRHLLDTLVTLDFVYEGVDLRLHYAVVRLGLPKPLLSVYLSVPAEVATARKPEDIFGVYAIIRRQLESYEARLGEIKDLHLLNGCRPANELAAVVTRWLSELQNIDGAGRR
ncbi:MAG: hypothetical protein JOZ19_07055 [Rubrobacter sp.]|nr:hypothetical protein [Rubrobacter sp.]